MASLLVVLIILGSAAYQYLKGTLIKSFTMMVIAICASVIAFGHFELLARILINRQMFVAWAQPLCFVLLFVLAFAILQAIAAQLTSQPIDLGFWPERIGSVVCGLVLGLILSGLLLTTLAMSPLSSENPYQRFNPQNLDAEKPAKALLNADGFTTGWFSLISSGSLSGKKSFAVFHPAFLDQVFLNRHGIAEDIPIITGAGAIEIPNKKAVWPAPQALKDSSGQSLPQKSGHNLNIVRIGILAKAIKDGGIFTLSQLRVICKKKSDLKRLFSGRGKPVYPIGYLKTAEQLQIKRLDEQIKVARVDFKGSVRWIDFAFYIPEGSVPVLVEFKQNNLAQLPPPVTTEQALPPSFFIQASECATDIAELQTIDSAEIYGIELAAAAKLLSGLTLEINDSNQWQNAQAPDSMKPALFEEGKINYVRAKLVVQGSTQDAPESTEKVSSKKAVSKRSWKKPPGLSKMLEPLDGYKLLSLRCKTPSVSAVITAEQLPVLVEQSGLIHHPVGVVASGKIDDQLVYEIDYCSLIADDTTDGLIIADDASVSQPFPDDTIWLTEQAQSISEFYILYMIKSGENIIITSVQPADSQIAAAFKKYEGFLIK